MASEQTPKLISIETVSWNFMNNPRLATPHWKVVMASQDEWGNRYMETTWHVAKKDFDEDKVLAVCRNYFARLCQDVGGEISDWVMTEEQYQDAKIKPSVSSESPTS